MRTALLLAVALVACSTNDASKSDSAAGTVAANEPAAPKRLTAADVAGSWAGTTKMEGTDSVVNRWTTTRLTDTTGTLVSDNTKEIIAYTVVYDADSMIATSKPFATTAAPKTKVMFRSVGRMKDGKLVGTSTTMLAAKPDSVLSRASWEATKKP
jgi:hypothetical protein